MVVEGSTPAPAVAPPPQRRPRVREVSSRFMSPLPTPAQHSVSAQRPRHHLDSEAEENKASGTVRSLESPFTLRRTNSDKVMVGRSSPLKHSTVVANVPSNLRARFNAATPSAAAKLLQSLSNKPPPQECSSSADDNCTSRSLPDLLPSRLLVERNIAVTASPNLTNSIKGTTSSKTSAISLPPVPKPAADAKKPKKVSTHQEEVHSLKLLYNHYLQWRFANAKAQNPMQSQKRETEKTFYSLMLKISDLYDTVKRKRIELAFLQRMKILSTVLETQMPYLDDWSAIQEDYLSSMSEATQALLNASLRIPISGNVRADVTEVGEAIKSAIKSMEMITCVVQNYMPKAHGIESLVSELARVMGRESALIEECGDLLSKSYSSQVEECSLRGELIQLHHGKLLQE